MRGPERIVVVGGGMAAARLVEELAAAGAGHHVTMLCDEPHPPYNRILLSALLEGTQRLDAISLHDTSWYLERGIDLRLGTRVAAVETATARVRFDEGTWLGYDRLVLATGSMPSLPPIRGLTRAGRGQLDDRVHALRHLDDCLRLSAAVPAARRAVVVGGGLLGLQVARALATRGLDVEVVEGGDHLLRSQVGPRAGDLLARDLRRLGTEVYTGARAVRLREDGLVLDNAKVLETDLVVLAAGGRPASGLAARAGIEVGASRGIVVDDTLTTSDPRVHAIGDCVEHRGRSHGFVAPAWEQAQVLARRLVGGSQTYDGSRIVARLRATDLDVAVLGDPLRARGEVVEVTNPLSGSHRRLVIDDGRIVAASLVGDLSRVGLITQHFDRGTVLGPSEPGALLMATRPGAPVVLPDEAEVCACAGVSAGRIRACSSVADARSTTRATTGCGGCAPTVRSLLAGRPGQSAPLLEGTRA